MIDWSHPPEFLDTELGKISPEHVEGSLAVDKLVRVRRTNGAEEWLLIHVEVQAQPERNFAERMFVYYYRIRDRFKKDAISLAVLADDNPDWKPRAFLFELAGCRQHFEFPVFKVIEHSNVEAEFERSGNVFALLVAAHQAALKTRRNPAARFHERFRLLRRLYLRGLDRETVIRLFRTLAWLTRMPEEMELRFRAEAINLAATNKAMTELLAPIELIFLERGLKKGREEGREKGLEQGREEAWRAGILDALDARFGPVPEELRNRISGIHDSERLRRGLRLACVAGDLTRFSEQL